MKVINGWCLLLLLISLGTAAEAQTYDAVVSATYDGSPGARISGRPTYATISAAIAMAPAHCEAPYRILIQPGRYYEKLLVTKPNIHLIGMNRTETILTYDACSDTPDPAGGTLTTWRCATLIVSAPGFCARHFTIENGFDYPANARKSDDDSTKIKNAQAVAVMLSSGSDRASFMDCEISGFQDTLFPNAGRSYYHNCRISGHVDFIFGAGQAVFSHCDIVSRDRPGRNPSGYITAPSTKSCYPYGFLFDRCRFLKESPVMTAGSVRLGRPWHPGGDPQASGSAIFFDCFMDDHVGPEGYAPIGRTDSTGRKVSYEVTPESRFFEYKSHGPGALRTPQRPVLPDDATRYHTPDQVLLDWRP